jgi:hypothetical protein
MYHLCHSDINFSINVKYCEVIGATLLKFHFGFPFYTALVPFPSEYNFLLTGNGMPVVYLIGMVLPALRVLQPQRQNKNPMDGVHISLL